MGGGFAACLPFLTKNKDKIEKIVKIVTEKDKPKDKTAKTEAVVKPTVDAAAPAAADTKPAVDVGAAKPAADATHAVADPAAKPADTATAGTPAAKPEAAAAKPDGAAAQAADFYSKHKKEIGSAVDMASKFLKKH